MIAALVPAAGRSERMGRPKLLLAIHGEPLIVRVVTALLEGGAERVLVVGPPEDSQEGPAIAALARTAGARVVSPRVRPGEMRDSIEFGLEAIARPEVPDYVLLTPGDAAGITATVVARLIEESARHPEKIVVPRCGPRRGHPLVLPWRIAAEVPSLPRGKGVDALLDRHHDRVVELPVLDPRIADDIDTPEDVRSWDQQPRDDQKAGDCGVAGQAVGSEQRKRVRVRVQFFALAKERAGVAEIEIELPPESAVADLRTEIGRRLPGLAPLMKNVMIAVNEEYADDATRITPGSRIAVIPPVSGGAGGTHRGG